MSKQDGAFSATTREAIALRARSECERCGRWCGEGVWREFHHRAPRGMGGAADERAALLDSPSNGLLLCRNCHAWIERNRSAASEQGWLVSFTDDPSTIPAFIYRRGLQLLSEQYTPFGAPAMRRTLRSGTIRTVW